MYSERGVLETGWVLETFRSCGLISACIYTKLDQNIKFINTYMHTRFQKAAVKSGGDDVNVVCKKGVFEVTQLMYGLYSSAIEGNLYFSYIFRLTYI
jgi:hypothetical protein